MHRKSRRFGGIALAGATALAISACGGASPSGGGSSGSPDLPVLTVGTAAALTNFADVYVAEAKGFFEQAGVDVEIQTGVGANGLNSVVSGQLDLLMFGTGQALIPASRGAETKIVYNQIGAGEGAALAVKADAPYQTPTDLSGKRVAVLGVGGSSYGWGEYFSEYAARNGGSEYDIQQTSGVGDQVNGVLSGHYDGMVSTGALLTSQTADGKMRLLVDPAGQSGEEYIPAQYVETCTFGIDSNLTSEKDAVTSFLAGMQAADRWMHDASPEEIAGVLKSNTAFDGQSLETVKAGIAYDKPFLAPSLGEITEPLWTETLTQLAYWGLPGVDLGGPEYSYGERIDMSYLDAASDIKIDIDK